MRRKILLTIIATLAIIGYGFFQGYDLIRGPVLEIFQPENGQSFNEPLVEIKGIAKNISFIYLNGNQIFVDSDGNFSEKLLLLPGYNIMVVSVKDKFNREVNQELQLILNDHASQEES